MSPQPDSTALRELSAREFSILQRKAECLITFHQYYNTDVLSALTRLQQLRTYLA
jgi:hypothetical protein